MGDGFGFKPWKQQFHFLQAKLKEHRCFHFWMMILLSSAVYFGFTFVMLLAGSFAFISVSVVVSFKQCFVSEVI